MARFHISSKGTPAICRAEKGRCPYGGLNGDAYHFDSAEEAQMASDELESGSYQLDTDYNENLNTPSDYERTLAHLDPSHKWEFDLDNQEIYRDGNLIDIGDKETMNSLPEDERFVVYNAERNGVRAVTASEELSATESSSFRKLTDAERTQVYKNLPTTKEELSSELSWGDTKGRHFYVTDSENPSIEYMDKDENIHHIRADEKGHFNLDKAGFTNTQQYHIARFLTNKEEYMKNSENASNEDSAYLKEQRQIAMAPVDDNVTRAAMENDIDTPSGIADALTQLDSLHRTFETSLDDLDSVQAVGGKRFTPSKTGQVFGDSLNLQQKVLLNRYYDHVNEERKADARVIPDATENARRLAEVNGVEQQARVRLNASGESTKRSFAGIFGHFF